MSATQQAGKPSKRVVLRDIASFVLGWLLIFQQALFVDPSRVNPLFLILAAGLVGTPAGAEAIARIRGGGTTSPPTASASSPSSPSSPTSQ